MPALLAWAAAWSVYGAASWLAIPLTAALLMATATGSAAAGLTQGRLRRLLVAGGFPLSALASGLTAAWPTWAWLLLLLPLSVAYPLRAWRDAPFFPTPAAALVGVHQVIGPVQRLVDAGCGLGHALQALRAEWPAAHCAGVEWSPLLALLARWRCRWAQIERADLWARPWHEHDLVYVFQRPESMVRLWAKAQAEMKPGAWLASLEFAVPGVEPQACWHNAGQRPLWLYRPNSPGPQGPRAPGAAAQSNRGPADNPRKVQAGATLAIARRAPTNHSPVKQHSPGTRPVLTR
ncbi:MAG: class I SAM-dependent methyltransferase [Rubrivivax sp.]|nr:class I SAM-dependent methyltransferase [Rubrivivax sp.]